jgi:tetratricopeptide (TPR) repeat protein
VVINELGRTDEALSCLDKIQFHEFNPDIMDGRFRILLKADRLDEASKTADHLMELDSQYYKLQLKLAQAFAERRDLNRAARLVENVLDPALDRGEGEAIEDQLKSILQQGQDHIPTLLVMIRYYSAANLTHNLPGLLEKVGNIYLRHEEIAEAASIYSQLARLEPDNPSHRETLKHIKDQLGSEGAEIELPRLVPDMSSIAEKFVTEPTIKTIAPDSSGDTTVADTAAEAAYSSEQVQSFMVEGDLFASYGLFRKAIEQYKRILEWIPHHIEVHEKIRDMCAKVGDLPQAAQECLALASIYTTRGDSEGANRNFALAYQYDPDLHQQPIYHDEATTAPLSVEPPAVSKPGPPPDEERRKGLLEEFDFYMEQGFFPEAKRCLDECLLLDPGSPEGRERLERYRLQTSGHEMPKAGETALEEARRATEFAEEISFEELESGGAPGAEEKVALEAAAETEPVAPPAVPVQADAATSTTVEGEEEVPAPPAPFADIMGHLNAELVGSALEKPAYSVKSRVKAEEVDYRGDSAESSSLAEVFAEFKEGLEDEDKEETDFETHYNLGIAFKEMDLLEEAIAEFQKALKGQSPVEDAEAFVRCCNMLGLCFVEKGLPQVAIKWFTKGLESPGRDEETYQALRYDLGCAQEKAGNPKAALETFLDVYGVNVNYRDVAEKIAHLKKSMNGQ